MHCSLIHCFLYLSLIVFNHCWLNASTWTLCSHISVDPTAKASLVAAMFRYYDRDLDNIITQQELEYGQEADHLQSIAKICSLPELLIQDVGGPGKVTELTELDLSGFYNVFSKYTEYHRLILM